MCDQGFSSANNCANASRAHQEALEENYSAAPQTISQLTVLEQLSSDKKLGQRGQNDEQTEIYSFFQDHPKI